MNPFLTPFCNLMTFFSTSLMAAIAFIVCAILLIAVAVTEAKGVVGNILRVVAAVAGILGLKSIITAVFGVTFGC